MEVLVPNLAKWKQKQIKCVLAHYTFSRCLKANKSTFRTEVVSMNTFVDTKHAAIADDLPEENPNGCCWCRPYVHV